MAQPVRVRDWPVQSLNRTPTRGAYACYTQQDYVVAERFFYSTYIKRLEEFGSWTVLTVASLNNWIIAMIKTHQYEKAEGQCKYILEAMVVANLSNSSCFICVQCNLASSFFLSGKIIEAESLHTTIKKRQELVGNGLARDYFEVLSLVRLTQKDCLVFWESGPVPSVLIPVADYIDQLEGMRPKKSILRSTLGSLRRMGSFTRPAGKASQGGDSTDGPQRSGSLVKKALGHLVDKQSTAVFDFGFKDINTRSTSASRPPEEMPLGAEPGQEQRDAAGQVAGIEEASDAKDKVIGWLDHQIRHPPLPQEPRASGGPGGSLEPAIGYTYRSITTTRSSIYGSKPQNQLEITAWAADIHPHTEKKLTVLLDGGAAKNSVSEDFASAINAPIEQTDNVHMVTANGQAVEVLGKIKVAFSWKGPSGTKFAKIGCYVVKNLQIGMLICQSVIEQLKLLESPSMLAILYTQRSKQVKRDDDQKSKQIAADAKAKAELDAARRKAERALLGAAAAAPVHSNITQYSRSGSLVGGSETSGTSRRSDMARSDLSGFDRSKTTSPTYQSLRTTTSMDSQYSRRDGSIGHRRSQAVCLRSLSK